VQDRRLEHVPAIKRGLVAAEGGVGSEIGGGIGEILSVLELGQEGHGIVSSGERGIEGHDPGAGFDGAGQVPGFDRAGHWIEPKARGERGNPVEGERLEDDAALAVARLVAGIGSRGDASVLVDLQTGLLEQGEPGEALDEGHGHVEIDGQGGPIAETDLGIIVGLVEVKQGHVEGDGRPRARPAAPAAFAAVEPHVKPEVGRLHGQGDGQALGVGRSIRTDDCGAQFNGEVAIRIGGGDILGRPGKGGAPLAVCRGYGRAIECPGDVGIGHGGHKAHQTIFDGAEVGRDGGDGCGEVVVGGTVPSTVGVDRHNLGVVEALTVQGDFDEGENAFGVGPGEGRVAGAIRAVGDAGLLDDAIDVDVKREVQVGHGGGAGIAHRDGVGRAIDRHEAVGQVDVAGGVFIARGGRGARRARVHGDGGPGEVDVLDEGREGRHFRNLEGHRVGEFNAAREPAKHVRSGRIHVDDRRVENGGNVVGPAVADQTVAEGGLAQVHHFRVEDDGLLALLAVGRMDSKVVAVVGAGAARVDGVVDEVVRGHGAGELHGHQEGNPVLLVGVRVTVQVFRVIDIAGDDDFGVAGGVDSPVHRVPLEARFCARVGVGAVQMESTGLHR